MIINEQQATHLARYLLKGINDSYSSKYKAIEINICKTGVIGVLKKRHCWILYIKYNGKLDKHAKAPVLHDYPSLPDVINSVKTIISNSSALANEIMDMSRIPIFDTHTDSDIIDLDKTDIGVVPKKEDIESDETEQNEVEVSEDLTELEEENEELIEEEEPTATVAVEEDISELLEDDEEEPLAEQSQSEYMTAEEVLAEENDSSYTEEIEESDEDYFEKQAEENDSQSTEVSDELNIDSLVKFTMENNVSHLSGASVEDNSYIYALMHTNPERYFESANKIMQYLVTNSQKDAAMFYINNVNRILEIYNNDVDKLAEELEIDKRDILLAIYEKRALL